MVIAPGDPQPRTLGQISVTQKVVDQARGVVGQRQPEFTSARMHR
jgi:hypothetical protein